MALPWGDVSTAFHTTGILNIEVFIAAPPVMIWGAWTGNLIAPLLSLTPIQSILKQAAATLTGPTAQARAASPCYVWGEARNAAGTIRTARIRTANGYDVTIHGALAVTQTLLTRNDGDLGSLTPARLCGVGLITSLAGSGLLTIS
jgi:short subunit dehydrogenase-like uncharacterized protein